MNLTGSIVLAFGIITLIGGIYGYISKASIISLIAGGVSGVILIISSIIIFKQNFAGIYISIIVALILAVHFGLSFSRELKIMPAGIMLVLSLIAIGFAVYALSQRE